MENSAFRRLFLWTLGQTPVLGSMQIIGFAAMVRFDQALDWARDFIQYVPS